MYRLVWWAFGHSSQQINVAAHVSIWYLTGAVLFGAKPMSEKVSRFAFFLYILCCSSPAPTTCWWTRA
jgi:cytochrome c oxidase subunit 1